MTDSKEEPGGDVMVATRVTPEVREQFGDLADKHNMSAAALLRELVNAMVERRLTIAPPKHVLYSMNSDKE